MAFKIDISQNDIDRISKNFLDLKDMAKRKYLNKILTKSAKPIVDITRGEAREKIKNTKTFKFKRRGVVYTIYPQTIMKSIGVITHNRSSVPMVSIGYRRKGKYDGWFASFVDSGTKIRTSKRTGKSGGKNRGSIEARNIMPEGTKALDSAQGIFLKEIDKELMHKWK